MSDRSSHCSLDWEWIYTDDVACNDNPEPHGPVSPFASPASSQHIVGARLGTEEVYRGDCVLLRAEASGPPWVAIIRHFMVDDRGQMAADFVWFSNEREIRNTAKKRVDFLPNEIYISLSSDVNPLDAIDGKASVVSFDRFSELYPSKKVPRRSPDVGKLFVCRRGLDMRTTVYTDEFVWEDIYRGVEDLDDLIEYVSKSTKGLHPASSKAAKERPLHDTTGQETPRVLTTPRKRRLSSSSPQRRENEFNEVYVHLEKAISNGSSNCIYISGTPGTGKTATVREVIRHLELAVEADELDDFIFVEINGMKITNPHQAYVILWEALKGDRVSPTQALDLLEREFSHPNPRRVSCVVLMDELDQLVTKNQSVMYNFFNWPSLKHSRLVVLAVANTMDLPERTLSNKISSRLGLTRIAFPGYTHDQLVQIIQSRLESVPSKIVEPDAVQFASRKVAAVSGDARRALDICRRAVELVEADQSPIIRGSAGPHGKSSRRIEHASTTVSISTIKRAINEATSNPTQHQIRCLPLISKLLLLAILDRIRRSRSMETTMADVTDEMTLMLKACSSQWEEEATGALMSLVPDSQVENNYQRGSLTPRSIGLGIAALDLEAAGIVILEEHAPSRPNKIRLAFSESDIRMALRDDHEIHRLGISL
ncbi:hypothetical protein jhhlp_006458 [Lomentospora prolificans]|uniref:Origin recognition complex subunit 1 n=1 Tax=Lomentospora prolificans TaxID=41688 RepID=A0A2N3N5Y0_9PEZI|nr:hypothetical protein jhhlp_006458 [Lomentospora prolificans]